MAADERPDRLEGRLRGRRLRRVLGRDHRPRRARQALLPRDQQLSCPAPANGRPRHRHSRRRRLRQSASGAGGDGGKFRIAMRLLHPGVHHGALRGLLPEGSQDRRPARRTALRESVPLHRLSPDPGRGRRCSRATRRARRLRRAAKKCEAETEIGSLCERGRNFCAPRIARKIICRDGPIPGSPFDRRRDRDGSRDHQEIPPVPGSCFGRSDPGAERTALHP